MPTINKTNNPLILAIDTSCDETSAAVTKGVIVLSNVVASQVDLHKNYGGVYPTLAKQAHKENIDLTIKKALAMAKTNFNKLNAIAVTQGPGLAPALEIGIAKAKILAKQYKKPLIAINHIEGHALSVLAKPSRRNLPKSLTQSLAQNSLKHQQNQALKFPILAIVVSGGHTQFIYIKKIGQYLILGQSIDDAAGESLDKVGRMLELGYPAGPVVEQLAKQGNPQTYKFPLPMTTSKNYNLSFSGLKTAALNLINNTNCAVSRVSPGLINRLNAQQTADFCASYQQAVFKHITYKLKKLLTDLNKNHLAPNCVIKPSQLDRQAIQQIWLGGGVAANIALRAALRQTLKPFGLKLITPYSKKLCGDNAAMIGLTAFFKWQNKKWLRNIDQLDREPRLSISL